MADSPVIVNNFYPLGYFATVDTTQGNPNAAQFWASEEALAPAIDTLTFDFGSERYVNFLDFEIAAKPVSIAVLYDSDGLGNYQAVSPTPDFEPLFDISYLPSDENPWVYVEYHFDKILTQRIQLRFIRREETFPFIDSLPFPFSIEVRNTRAAHLITQLDDAYDDEGTFIIESGNDILGNFWSYGYVDKDGNTLVEPHIYAARNATDGDPDTFWQCQPNPDKYAVEALYFDLRTGYSIGTMADMDLMTMDELENFTMEELDGWVSQDSVTVDEIYVDPITQGPIMHIYWSNDDGSDWDLKLWTPIPRHYILKRGFHPLPGTITAKYIKLEFTELVAQPYNTLDYPALPAIRYRKYPTWVQNYLYGLFPAALETAIDKFIDPFERSTIEPLDLFRNVHDQFDNSFVRGAFTPEVLIEDEDEVKNFIGEALGISEVDQTLIEQEIQYLSPEFWHEDLTNLLDTKSALSRMLLTTAINEGEILWLSESPLNELDPPQEQTVEDLTPALKEKQTPIMWFPLRCRHTYQVIDAKREDQVAYFVAIREVSFHRRDYESVYDEVFYIETLSDQDHIDFNEFIPGNWNYVVGS